VTARDFDDAISLTRADNGHWLLGVHIADVSHFVQPKTALDREAKDRATSVYLPDRVIPMLPEIISNNLASLQPDRVRYAITARIEFTADGVRHWDRSVQERDQEPPAVYLRRGRRVSARPRAGDARSEAKSPLPAETAGAKKPAKAAKSTEGVFSNLTAEVDAYSNACSRSRCNSASAASGAGRSN
jgi:hypothetical protein